MIYEVCKLCNETDFFQILYSNKITIVYCYSQNDFLLKPYSAGGGSSILIEVLELRYWNSLQRVGYSRLNIFDCPKMSCFEVIFQSRKEKKVTMTKIRLIWRLRYHRNVFTGQKLIY